MLNAPMSPNLLVEVAVEPTIATHAGDLAAAIGNMVAEDPSFAAYTDSETGQTIIGGIDELHLASKLDHLRRVYSPDIKAGTFQVAYRESIGCKSEIIYTHKKHLGPMSQYACVKIIFEPGEPGSGFLFENSILDGSVPKEYIPGVERGLALAAKSGWLAGFPAIQLKATLAGGAYHDIDSSPLAFEIAARGAFHELRDKGQPMLLEPIMEVKIYTDEDRWEAILADLSQRDSQLDGEIKNGGRTITALVPLATMLGYASDLRDLAGDRARFTMRYHSYRERLSPEPPDDLFPSAIGLRA